MVGYPSSIEFMSFSSSTARFGSLCSTATAARIVGSQYLCTSVSSGRVLSSSAASFSAPDVSPVRAKANAAMAFTSLLGAQHSLRRVPPRGYPLPLRVTPIHLDRKPPFLWHHCARRNPWPAASALARSSTSRTTPVCLIVCKATSLPIQAFPWLPRRTVPSALHRPSKTPRRSSSRAGPRSPVCALLLACTLPPPHPAG